jgi:hypothetical protein
MEALSYQAPLNATQLFVLRTFATAKTEKDRDAITSLYLDYVQRNLDVELDKWWDENDMTNEKIEEMLNTHHRTPSK